MRHGAHGTVHVNAETSNTAEHKAVLGDAVVPRLVGRVYQAERAVIFWPSAARGAHRLQVVGSLVARAAVVVAPAVERGDGAAAVAFEDRLGWPVLVALSAVAARALP